MRIVVVGAGGVGGLIGGLLAKSGVDVAFVARGKNLAALRARGLRVQGPRGTFTLERVSASDNPSRLSAADVVLVAVKSWQVTEVAPKLRPLLAHDGYVVPLENGVEAADVLAAELGDERVAGGLCAMFAWLDAPGVVKHAGAVVKVTLGERRVAQSPRLEQLAAQLTAANVDVEVAPDIDAAMWEKFLFIASFGAVAAVTRAPAGVVRSLPETRQMLVAALEEVATLARARGVHLREDAVTRVLGMVDALGPETTASMQRDIMASRPSELLDQSGAIVRMAAASRVPAPTHGFLFASLLPQERAARGQG